MLGIVSKAIISCSQTVSIETIVRSTTAAHNDLCLKNTLRNSLQLNFARTNIIRIWHQHHNVRFGSRNNLTMHYRNSKMSGGQESSRKQHFTQRRGSFWADGCKNVLSSTWNDIEKIEEASGKKIVCCFLIYMWHKRFRDRWEEIGDDRRWGRPSAKTQRQKRPSYEGNTWCGYNKYKGLQTATFHLSVLREYDKSFYVDIIQQWMRRHQRCVQFGWWRWRRGTCHELQWSCLYGSRKLWVICKLLYIFMNVSLYHVLSTL